MKTGIIIQARVSSERLPNKVLKELPYAGGVTVLGQVIRRLKKIRSCVDEIIVATTIGAKDNPIEKIAESEGVNCFKGDENDVLSRYYHAAMHYKLDIIVRITADCPCIDPAITASVIDRHKEARSEYTSNTLLRTYPRGFDTEVFHFNALKQAYQCAKKDYEREHVTPFIYLNPEKFRILNVPAPQELAGPDIRITLDTEEDYALLAAVYDYLYPRNNYFDAYEIADLFREKPWLKLINIKVRQKQIFSVPKAGLIEGFTMKSEL